MSPSADDLPADVAQRYKQGLMWVDDLKAYEDNGFTGTASNIRTEMQNAQQQIIAQKTAEMKALVAKGIDPREMKQSAVIDNMKLTKHMINEFIEIYAKPRNTSWKQAQYNLNRYVVPFIGRKPIAEIKRADLHIILDKLSEQGKNITCNRTNFFNYTYK